MEFADACTPEMLIENFLINFVLKKPFYLYGLQQGMSFLDNMWQKIEKVRRETLSLNHDMKRTSTIIMNLEFQYSHNRRALLKGEEFSSFSGTS